MPNWVDDGARVPDRLKSNRHGAVRAARRASPVYCEYEYPNAPDEEALCANLAIRHTDPPRCASHGGVHSERGRKRTEAGYVRVNPRMAAIVAGELDVSELDDEELARGQVRATDGKFHGKTQLVPRAMYAKMTQELFKRADELMKTSLTDAVKVLMQIAKNPQSDPKDAMKAAQWIVERVMGKTAEQVVVHQEKPWQQMLVNVTSDDPQAYENFVRNQIPDEDDERF